MRPPFAATRKAVEIGGAGGHDQERQRIERRVQKEVERVLGEQLARIMAQVSFGAESLGADFWGDEADVMVADLLPVIGGIVDAAILIAVSDLQAAVHVGIDPAALEARLARWARKYTFKLIKGIDANTRRIVQESMRNWALTGGTVADLRKMLESSFGKVRAELIAVTEVTRAFAKAHHETWVESGVVVAREWRTAEDLDVCPICRDELNEEQAPLGEMFPGDVEDPPAHPRCRCWTVPIIPERLR